MTHLPPAFHYLAVFAGCAVLAYLLGSIPFGLILGKLCGEGDIRKIGSGNIGATNMLRTGNRNLAAATLLLDMAKGFAALIICSMIISSYIHQETGTTGVQFSVEHIVYFFGLCAVAGHVWPVWLNFKGGKGVATTIGVYLACAPLVGVATILCWIVVFHFSRFSSLAALISIGLSPVLGYIFINGDFGFIALLLVIIIAVKHKENIRRLRDGTETKWKKSNDPA